MESEAKPWLARLRSFDEVIKGLPRNAGESDEQLTERWLAFLNKEIKTPERFADAHPYKMDRKVREWVRSAAKCDSVFLTGGVGTGKTYSLYALAKLYRANGLRVTVKNMTEWLDELRSTFDKDARAELTFSQIFSRGEVLLIDDVGAEKVTDWSIEIMYKLVNKRYELGRYATGFSTNLSLEEIGKVYGERIASRIVEMCGRGEGILSITGEDRRTS